MFIGSQEIKTVVPVEGGEIGDVKVIFVDDKEELMKQATLDLISSQEKGEGLTNDAIRYFFASKYIKDMSEHGLNYGELSAIAQGIQNLGINMREQATAMAFDATHLSTIKVSEVFKLFAAEEKEEDDAEEALDTEEKE